MTFSFAIYDAIVITSEDRLKTLGITMFQICGCVVWWKIHFMSHDHDTNNKLGWGDILRQNAAIWQLCFWIFSAASPPSEQQLLFANSFIWKSFSELDILLFFLFLVCAWPTTTTATIKVCCDWYELFLWVSWVSRIF